MQSYLVKLEPLLKSEWVGCAEERPVGAVKGGRSPAKRTLDGDPRDPTIELG
jgi:hypothetical protein